MFLCTAFWVCSCLYISLPRIVGAISSLERIAMERYSEGFGFILTFGLLTLLSLNLVPKCVMENLDVK